MKVETLKAIPGLVKTISIIYWIGAIVFILFGAINFFLSLTFGARNELFRNICNNGSHNHIIDGDIFYLYC